MKPYRSNLAFSLIEVVVSLSLITFCITVLMGLIPVGLGAIQNSVQRSGAVNSMEQIDTSIRGATTNTSGQYQGMGMYTNLVWKLGGATTNVAFTNLSLSGSPTAVTSDQCLAAEVQLNPPANGTSAGTAIVTVAWPKAAKWNATTMRWSNAQGSVSTWVIFNPSP